MSYNKPLSPSGLKLFKKCPQKWKRQYIDGFREAPGPAARRGTELHSHIEDFIRRGHTFPSHIAPLGPWKAFIESLPRRNAVAEGQVAVDADWQPVEWDDPAAFYRGIIDVKFLENIRLTIVDWKSGRIYPEHEEQGESYVALSPPHPEYETAFVYLDHPPTIQRFKYTAEDREGIQLLLSRDIHAVRNAEEYPPKPDVKTCEWCPFSWRRGGDCRAAP